MNIAIVHEWLVNYYGSEKCVESFTNIWSEAPIYALVDFLKEEDRKIITKGKHAHTSFIQRLPLAKKHHRIYLPLFPIAVEQHDVSSYEVVLSSSHSVAKGVLTNSNQLHICYCHTPIRYAWDLYHQYLNDLNIKGGLKGAYVRWTLHKIRMWDYISSNRVDYFIANSAHIAKRIKKIYNRNATVIHPPVDTNKIALQTEKENYYLTASRFVPYKKIDLIVEAFAKMPERKLVVIGEGPDKEKIKTLARKNVEILPRQNYDKLVEYIQKAKAFIFAAEEDFGITMVEAHAAGTPVIAYNVGGASEIVKQNETGILFNRQSVESLIHAIDKFEKSENKFDPAAISEYAQKFSRENFESNISNFVKSKYKDFFNKPL